MNTITIEELNELIPRVRIIDIRDNYQYNLGKIPTAVNIPYNFLVMNPENYLDKNETYYLYCEYGNRSKKACLLLSSKGYDTIDILGGYHEYQAFLHRR